MPRRHLWKAEIDREIERIQSEQPEIFYSEEYTVPRAKNGSTSTSLEQTKFLKAKEDKRGTREEGRGKKENAIGWDRKKKRYDISPHGALFLRNILALTRRI